MVGWLMIRKISTASSVTLLWLLIMIGLTACSGLGEATATPIPTPRPPTPLPPPTATTPPTYSWERFDVTIDVLANGDLRIVERQRLHFAGRSFTYGFRLIPGVGLKDITGVSVGQENIEYALSPNREPYTYLVEADEQGTLIGWFFPESVGIQTYEFRYTVRNRVQADDQGDFVRWTAISANLDSWVEAGEIVVTVPAEVAINSAQVVGGRLAAAEVTSVALEEGANLVDVQVSADGRQATFTLNQPRPVGVDVAVDVRVPRGSIVPDRPEPFRILVGEGVVQSPPNRGYSAATLDQYRHGVDYLLAGQADRAMAEFDRVLAREPVFAEAYYLRGIAHLSKGFQEDETGRRADDVEQAIADFDLAIGLEPTFAEAYIFRSLAFSMVGEIERANADIEQALALDPQLEERIGTIFEQIIAGLGTE